MLRNNSIDRHLDRFQLYDLGEGPKSHHSGDTEEISDSSSEASQDEQQPAEMTEAERVSS